MLSSSYEESIGVVIDLGSMFTKAGFATESFPRAVFPTAVGRFRHQALLDGIPQFAFGHDAIQKQGISNFTWPVESGLIKDWNEMEKLWHHTFFKELLVPPETTRVLHAVHPQVPREDRVIMAEILFETFNVNYLYLVKSPVLVIHSSGRTTGIVYEIGAECAYAAPIYEGFPLRHAITTTTLTGEKLTDVLTKSLYVLGYSFTTPVERQIVNDMKAKLCYVASHYEEEININGDKQTKYNLPDGQQVIIGNERFKCPEVLFQPSLHDVNCLSLVDVICKRIERSETEYQKVFYENIVLSGGTTRLKGLGDRLLGELSRRPKLQANTKVAIDKMQQRQNLAWTGGSIIASLRSFKGFWISKQEYDDIGGDVPAVIIDNGSYCVKAGFSCDNHPVAIFHSVVGRPKDIVGPYGRPGRHYEVRIGDDAVERRDDLNMISPVVDGRIVHWDNMERVWHHIFYRELKVAPEDRAVIMTAANNAPMSEK